MWVAPEGALDLGEHHLDTELLHVPRLVAAKAAVHGMGCSTAHVAEGCVRNAFVGRTSSGPVMLKMQQHEEVDAESIAGQLDLAVPWTAARATAQQSTDEAVNMKAGCTPSSRNEGRRGPHRGICVRSACWHK